MTASDLGECTRNLVASINAAELGGEAYCLTLGALLSDAHAAFTAITIGFHDLRTTFDGSEQATLAGSLSDVDARLADLVSGLSAEAEQIKAIEVGVEHVAMTLDQLRRAMRTLSVLAVNSKVEAAGLPTREGEVQDFAKTLSALAGNASHAIETCATELSRVSRVLSQARAALTRFERENAPLVHAALERLRRGYDLISACRTEFAERSAMLAGRTAAIEDRVGALVMDLQIGDRTRQRVEHVVTGLSAATNRLDEGEDVMRGALRLAANLIAGAGQDLATASGEITDGFKALLTQARDLRPLLHPASKDGKPSGDVIAFVSQELQAALTVGERSSLEWAEVQAKTREVSDVTESLNGQLQALKDLSDEMAMIGINAVLNARGAGGRGRGLCVIADQVRTLAQRITADVAAATPDLLTLVADAENLRGSLIARQARLGDGGRSAAENALQAIDALQARADDRRQRLSAEIDRSLGMLVAGTPHTDASYFVGALEALRRNLSELHLCSRASSQVVSVTTPVASHDMTNLQLMFESLYTMDAERDIHCAFFEAADEKAVEVRSRSAQMEGADRFTIAA